MADPSNSIRPEPEALLNEAKKEGRGRLKVFLGMAPGVGKTYAMLQAGKQRKAEGKDVVIGIVETHGRKETLALIEGHEVLPRQIMRYRERDFEEMDLEALLKRKPEIALVDELAHTNIEGSLHTKRYQDVEELLAHGIDVYTTLNIQHLESLNDVIERITQVKVRETLPDSVLQTADEIELIDLPPDELIKRLNDGKVYMGDQAHLAMRHFFTRGNLTALREMALRAAAERVDKDISDYLKTHAIAGIWPTKERLLVCISDSGNPEGLIRNAARAAERSRVPWIVLYVETGADAMLSEKTKDMIADSLSLAEKLGAEAVTIRGGTNIASDILAYARSRNVSRIMIGRGRKSVLWNLFFPPVINQLIENGPEFDITLLNAASSKVHKRSRFFQNIKRALRKTSLKDYVFATICILFAILLGTFLRLILPLPNLAMIFLMAILVTAIKKGLWPSLYAVFLAVCSYNFFFTEPRFTLFVYSHHDLITLIFFLAVAILAGNLAVRLKNQIEALQDSANRNALMHDFSRKLSAALSMDDVTAAAVSMTSDAFKLKIALLMPAPENHQELSVVASKPINITLNDIDWAAAQWAFNNDKPAGLDCDTLPAAKWLFKPLRSPNRLVGLMAIAPYERDKDASFLSPEQRRMLYAFCDQTALAIERARLSVDIEESRLQNETERLRNALLSSISHDLRTPLASIMGSATTLSHMDESLTRENRADLTQNILLEAERLNRFVQNLLDMTKLGHGAMTPKREWCGDFREILGRSMHRLQKELKHHKVEFRIDESIVNLYIDPALMEQVILNILENAVKYSPPETRIVISLEKKPEAVFLKIRDQGYGIPEADQEKVFDMFYRVRAGDSKVAGTGLGLAICRGIIEAHGGTIRAEAGFSGKGTVISIQLPAAYAREKSFYGDDPPPPDLESAEK